MQRREPRDEDGTGRGFPACVARLRGRRARRECYVELVYSARGYVKGDSLCDLALIVSTGLICALNNNKSF